jgi:uncharacterized protein (TIGR02246 family)
MIGVRQSRHRWNVVFPTTIRGPYRTAFKPWVRHNRETTESYDDVRALHRDWLESWNVHDAGAFATYFTLHGVSVGFDGSTIEGRDVIESHLRSIFELHQTAAYATKVRELRLLSADVALLRGVVGMVPPGLADINPAVNAVQSLLAVRQDGRWRIAQLQNTPAAFHGRPDLSDQLTGELRAELRTIQ